MGKQQAVYDLLNKLDIKHEKYDHTAAFTIEDIDRLNLSSHGDVCKNLFLRDYKGNNHYLVVLHKDKLADLKNISEQIGSSKLSFASAERLEKYLNLEKGSVTPLAVINDTKCCVKVVLDEDLKGQKRLGLHPNVNTATVFISYEDLCKYISFNGNTIINAKI